MQIIIEGPDNSGKSTLASELSARTGLPVYRSEGKPKHKGEINERIRTKYAALGDNIILDRHPCISEPIYGTFRTTYDPVDPKLIQEFYASRPFIIYCRGRDLTGHIVKDHDTPEHVEMVETHHFNICSIYDQWALQHANMVFRIGDPVGAIARAIQDFDVVRDVEDFHRKFDQLYNGRPRVLDQELQDFRVMFLEEELEEYIGASVYAADMLAGRVAPDPGEFVTALESQIDSLVDLVYVALGTAHLQGFDFRTAWRRVQRANMAKVMATSAADSKRGYAGDVVKPDGWEAPSHKDLVEVHAHLSLFR